MQTEAQTRKLEGFSFNDRTQGFCMTFANGWNVSVVWGGGTYSSNRDAEYGKAPRNSRTAETLVWKGDDISNGTEDGWLTADKVAALLAEVAARGE